MFEEQNGCYIIIVPYYKIKIQVELRGPRCPNRPLLECSIIIIVHDSWHGDAAQLNNFYAHYYKS